MTGRAMVLRGDARALPLPDESVDLIVTSPPYYALRAYQDGGQTYDGQIGSEATPAEYVAALLDCTREWVRVLKPSGSLFVNLGDKYAGGGGQWENDECPDPGRRRAVSGKIATGGRTYGLRPKSLLGLPWRYALGCVDQLGLILRAEILWSKPNGLPESVTDRVRRSHEQWFHFTRRPRYYSAVDEIREPHAAHTLYCAEWEKSKPGGRYTRQRINQDRMDGGNRTSEAGPNKLGKLPGSVWEIATEPLRVPEHLGVDHFAAFPTEWPRRIIAGWSPPGICVECGEGRRPVVDRKPMPEDAKRLPHRVSTMRDTSRGDATTNISGQEFNRWRAANPEAITGYVCACPEPTAPTRPAIVLDPFGGTGTTALVASVLGRIGISVDYSTDYSRLAVWRTTDPGERARAMRVPKPPPQLDGQLSLLDHLEVT